ncbi:MAG TPA: EF-P beta-lysylation protein EpmB [Pseudomonadales bacterium]
MIPLKHIPWQSDAWTVALADAITDARELLVQLQLADGDVDIAPDFPLRVPRAFVERMRIGDPADPLLRQILPTRAERESMPGYDTDPLEEAAATRAPGVIQKYHGRALLIAAPACAVHCRYCFRRTFPYADHQQGVAFPSLAAIEADPTITEVILSGGDPLMLKAAPLARLVRRLDAIRHLRRIRIHTRLPVVIPQRVTNEFVELLTGLRCRASIVLHVNHPNEIDGAFVDALAALHRSGITLLNQSVLLRGVNDDATVLEELSERLFDNHVLPYYLHLPDRVVGTHHFDVPEAEAQALMAVLTARLPGYLVPRLVREVPGFPAKQVVSSA